MTREEAVSLRGELKETGVRVGFTSGVYDLLHAGHVSFLAQAKAECDFLFVGVNSDSSVKQNKGPARPINTGSDRMRVLAALESVSGVFLFDERNNNENVEVLQPDVYLKAGDYTKEQLSSAPIVESHGGEVVIVKDFVQGRSTTSIIDSICNWYDSTLGHTKWPNDVPAETRPAAFFDRDGTINTPVPYLHEPEKFELLPGALEGMKAFQELGYRIVIVTNQAGIGLGYFSKEDFFLVTRELLRAAGKAGVFIDKVYFSPFTPAVESDWRKPGIGMLSEAKKDLNIDLSKSVMIGDMTSDIQTGINAGCKTILVKTGAGGTDKLHEVTADYEADDLLDAAHWAMGNLPLPENAS